MNAQQFSEQFPAGTKVKFFPIAGNPEFEETEIRSEAWELGHGAVVVKVKGRSGCVSVDHIIRDNDG